MTICDRGPNNTPGCDQELEWVRGKWYSPHYEASHWSRRKKGTAKPKKNIPTPAKVAEPGLAINMTEAQVRAALNDTNAALKQSGKVN